MRSALPIAACLLVAAAAAGCQRDYPFTQANGEPAVEAARGADTQRVLGSRPADAGCAPTLDERAEVLRAVEGALLGPKGTLMDGQTTALKVTSVTFDR